MKEVRLEKVGLPIYPFFDEKKETSKLQIDRNSSRKLVGSNLENPDTGLLNSSSCYKSGEVTKDSVEDKKMLHSFKIKSLELTRNFLNEDDRLQRFLNLLSHKSKTYSSKISSCNCSNKNLTNINFFTVPLNLSRRILNRQGAGYLDDAVAMITSAAADRFLATTIRCALACRDRRIAGSKLSSGKLKSHHNLRKRQIDKIEIEGEKNSRDNFDESQTIKSFSLSEKNTNRSREVSNTILKKKPSKIGEMKKSKTNIPSLNSNTNISTLEDEHEMKTETLYGDSHNGSMGENNCVDNPSKYYKDKKNIKKEDNYYEYYYGLTNEDLSIDLNHRVNYNKMYKFDLERLNSNTLLLRDFYRPLSAWGIDTKEYSSFFLPSDKINKKSDFKQNNRSGKDYINLEVEEGFKSKSGIRNIHGENIDRIHKVEQSNISATTTLTGCLPTHSLMSKVTPESGLKMRSEVLLTKNEL